jgi:hypothetical protein
MDRRSFLQALSYLSVLACACRRGTDGAGASGAAATRERVDALIEQRIAEENVDYVTLLEANPNILRRAPPGQAESMRRTLREHPEAVAEMNAFRVSALRRLKEADLEPKAKMLMLDAQLEKVPHAVTTCMEHFIGVHGLLKAWGQADELALVGLFHAMYGTEYFVVDLLDYRRSADRQRMRSVVGEKTERWILQYGLMLSRDFVAGAHESGAPPAHLDFFEKTDVIPATITSADFVALAELQVANAYEPFTHSGKTVDLGNVTPYVPLREFLSSGAKAAIDATLRSLPAGGG